MRPCLATPRAVAGCQSCPPPPEGASFTSLVNALRAQEGLLPAVGSAARLLGSHANGGCSANHFKHGGGSPLGRKRPHPYTHGNARRGDCRRQRGCEARAHQPNQRREYQRLDEPDPLRGPAGNNLLAELLGVSARHQETDGSLAMGSRAPFPAQHHKHVQEHSGAAENEVLPRKRRDEARTDPENAPDSKSQDHDGTEHRNTLRGANGASRASAWQKIEQQFYDHRLTIVAVPKARRWGGRPDASLASPLRVDAAVPCDPLGGGGVPKLPAAPPKALLSKFWQRSRPRPVRFC